MAKLLGFYCHTCGKSEDVLTFDQNASATSLAPKCCGRRMVWSPSIGLFITSPGRLKHGRVITSVGADYLQTMKQDEQYHDRYSTNERRLQREEKETHDKDIKEGHKDRKIQVSG